jgi:hypothetical protein
MASARKWGIDADTTLYAKWSNNTYTVTFNKQSGTGGSNSVVATYDTAMPVATAPTRTGYTFGGYFAVDERRGDAVLHGVDVQRSELGRGVHGDRPCVVDREHLTR